MTHVASTINTVTITAEGLAKLIEELTKEGYRVVGPTVRDGAIVYDDVNSIADLPQGWTDEHEAATYRLKKRDDNALFGYTVGPHSWKKFFFPSVVRLMKARRNGDGFAFEQESVESKPLALIGVRACEIKAIRIQDKVFLEGPYVDSNYKRRREGAFIVAVNCGQAGKTCFCVSMDAGPKTTSGFDLALTEIIDKDQHSFVVEIGSERGRQLMEKISAHPARQEDISRAEAIIENTKNQMGRSLETKGIKELLYGNLEHPRWDQVAERCLSCANCTMVCPTCFCSTVEDVTDLTGDHAERWRKWDPCFSLDFSYAAGGHARSTVKSRYRQWMTHKLATWIDQFGESGCVGCGRCITWCPVGIDITVETKAIRESKG